LIVVRPSRGRHASLRTGSSQGNVTIEHIVANADQTAAGVHGPWTTAQHTYLAGDRRASQPAQHHQLAAAEPRVAGVGNAVDGYRFGRAAQLTLVGNHNGPTH